jgi:hypothetical protein
VACGSICVRHRDQDGGCRSRHVGTPCYLRSASLDGQERPKVGVCENARRWRGRPVRG